MPPWKPEPGHGEFVGERRLSSENIALIQAWVDQGAVEGNPRDLPAVPQWDEGWQLGTPDLVVQMPVPYALNGSGSDVLRNFVIPIPLATKRFVRGIEFRPGNPKVVHHATMRIDQTQASRRLDDEDPLPGYEGPLAPDARYPDGHFLAWTPGQLRPLADDGLAWRLEPDSALVLQLHLQRGGKPELVQPSIAFFFTDVAPKRRPSMIRLSREDIDIPAGQRDYAIEDRYVLPVDVELRELQPHAHYLAKEITGAAQLPDGTTRSLIYIKEWDFNWQDVYRLRVPMLLPKGTTLLMRYTYDNSADNPRNVSSPRRVRWGQNTSDEMGDLWLQVMPRSVEDLSLLEQETERKILAEDIRGYERLLELDPSNGSLHETLASGYLQAGRRDEAVQHLEVSLGLNPQSPMTHYNLGTALLVLGRFAEAASHFEDALRLRPDSAYAENSLAQALRSQGKLDEAIEHYRRALVIEPNYAHAHNNLGTALQSLGRFDEAITHYAQATRIKPDDAVPERNWGKALMAQNLVPRALAHFRQALTLMPEWPALLVDLAWILAAHQSQGIRAPAEAVVLAERAARLTEFRDPRILDVLAAAYASASQFEKAVSTARTALTLTRGDRSAADIRARLSLYEARKPYREEFSKTGPPPD